MIFGTLINIAAVLAGGLIGLLLKGKIPSKISDNVTRAIGLCVCIIGISGSLKGDMLLLVVCLALGAFTGEMLRIEDRLDKLSAWLGGKFSKNNTSTFSEGFVGATLLFCVGAMAVVGSIEAGLSGNYSIILTKAILDGVSAVVLASSFGFGVLFSVFGVLVYQGSIEFFAAYLQGVLTEGLITQISAAGSVMILALGLNMVLNAKIKTANLLPGLLFAVGYYCIFLI